MKNKWVSEKMNNLVCLGNKAVWIDGNAIAGPVSWVAYSETKIKLFRNAVESNACGEWRKCVWADGGVDPQIIYNSSLSWPHLAPGLYAPTQTSHWTKAVLKERS